MPKSRGRKAHSAACRFLSVVSVNAVFNLSYVSLYYLTYSAVNVARWNNSVAQTDIKTPVALLVRQMYLACAHMGLFIHMVLLLRCIVKLFTLLATDHILFVRLQIMPGDKQSFPALRHHPHWCCAQSGWGHCALHHRGQTTKLNLNQEYMLQTFFLIIV